MHLRSRSPSRYRDGGIKLGRATANAAGSSGVSNDARLLVDALDQALLDQFHQYLTRHSFKHWEWVSAHKLEDHWRVTITYTGSGATPHDSAFALYIQQFPCVVDVRSSVDTISRATHTDHIFLQLTSARAGARGYLHAGERRQPMKLVSRRSFACRAMYATVLILMALSVYVLGLRSLYPERYY